MTRAKCVAVFAGLAWGCGLASAAVPVRSSEATARVHVRVEPQIAVSEPQVVVVELQDRWVGSPIPSQVRFSIRANTRQVELQVACTDLCKAGNPTSAYKIPVAQSGVEIASENESHSLAWLHDPPTGILPAGWSGEASEVGIFAASSGDTFNQSVTVNVSWQSMDLDLPTGQYCGIVKLIAMVGP
ncbi:MAG: hypothetical protein ABFE13_01420 [Phycisphaerales bacterium]